MPSGFTPIRRRVARRWRCLSLNEVARRLIARDELKRAVADPFVRRLLVAYVASRERDYAWDENAGAKDPVVVLVSEAVLSRPAPAAGQDLDRLAALAYQAGRYELAERLTVATNQPLGLWVRAKLALWRGDRAAAVRDWTAALTATENAGDAPTLDTDSKTRLRGELAVVRLSQGEYRDSLRLLFPVAGTYWGDVAYITERVLTVDELKAFVDALPAAREATPSTDDGFWSSSFSPSRTCAPCWRGVWFATDGLVTHSLTFRRQRRDRRRTSLTAIARPSTMLAIISPQSRQPGPAGHSTGRGRRSLARKPCSKWPRLPVSRAWG